VVSHVAVLGVIPVLETWEAMTADFAMAAFQLFFLAQPDELPERLLAAAPEAVLDFFLDRWCATPGAIEPDARAAYLEALGCAESIRAICADYRAGTEIDLEHDRADRDAGRRITAPMLVLWEQPGGIELPFDPLAIWRRWASKVTGGPLSCGHFLPEERPEDVTAALRDHVGASPR
jgi:pimeloyl-ACP methyl ester carboxylesterase